MFMQPSCVCPGENVCWLVPQASLCNKPLYKSCFADKVRFERWAQKEGCCKTIGPPPKVLYNCPAHFLKKHSRTVPVYFKPHELRVPPQLQRSFGVANQERNNELPPVTKNALQNKRRNKGLTSCPYPKPPSRMGLFRSPSEKPYELRYRNLPRDCECEQIMWEDLIEATDMASRMAAEEEGKKTGIKPTRPRVDEGPPKDYIRSNALHVIRMPPRRPRRCYIDKCGVHLIDMSDSPYVLRPGFGKVPAYIYRRKFELLQEEIREKQEIQARAMQDYQPVADYERAMVIAGLKDYWGRLLHDYNSLPLQAEGNERQRELKHNLEERMKEVEADIKLLTSTNMLYVGDVVTSHYL